MKYFYKYIKSVIWGSTIQVILSIFDIGAIIVYIYPNLGEYFSLNTEIIKTYSFLLFILIFTASNFITFKDISQEKEKLCSSKEFDIQFFYTFSRILPLSYINNTLSEYDFTKCYRYSSLEPLYRIQHDWKKPNNRFESDDLFQLQKKLLCAINKFLFYLSENFENVKNDLYQQKYSGGNKHDNSIRVGKEVNKLAETVCDDYHNLYCECKKRLGN
jgi:hypothetical protein